MATVTSLMQPCRMLCATLACAAALPAAHAAAQDRGNLVAASPAVDETADGGSQPRVRITIGPQTVQPGEARYADRSTVAGKAQIVEFSATPPRAAAGARGRIGVPAGMPVSSARLTSGFGLRLHPISGQLRAHSGVDLAAAYGSPIVATADGVVSTADWTGGYGLMVSIAHGGGVQTRYGHLSRLNVAAGQEVHRGEVIGFVGSTGESTGPHVHYEIRVDGAAIDPLQR